MSHPCADVVQLDPAKMNRAIYLLRPEIEDRGDLQYTAKSLVQGRGRDDSALVAELPKITDAYIALVQAERADPIYSKRSGGNFTGLRDFYSFVKMLDKMVRGGAVLDSQTLLHVLYRNFGGFRQASLRHIVAR